MGRHPVVALAHQRAHGGGRDAQVGDAVALDQRPQPVGLRDSRARPRTARRSRPASGCRLMAHGPIIQPMSVIQKSRSPGCTSKQWAMSCARLDREAAVDVHDAFGPPGGAAGVDDHVGVFGVGRLGRRTRRLRRPPARATTRRARPSRALAPQPAHDQHMLDGRAGRRRLRRRPLSSARACPRRQKPSAVISSARSQSASRAATAAPP